MAIPGPDIHKELTTAIAVLTYNRPEGLAALLAACETLKFETEPNSPAFGLIVVDNSESGNARAQCELFATSASFQLFYEHQATPGIAVSRNRAIDRAHELGVQWLAFIDDDERPDPQWLQQLLHAKREFAAEAISGPVLAQLDDSCPEWVKKGGFFNRPLFRTGQSRPVAFTNNCLINLDFVFEKSLRFDESLNLCGGEDRMFFEELKSAGGKIIWEAKAIVFEDIPLDRCNPEWLKARQLRTGAAMAFIKLKLDNGLSTRLGLVARAMFWQLWGLIGSTLSRFANLETQVRYARFRAYGEGLAQGIEGDVHAEYARDDSTRS